MMSFKVVYGSLLATIIWLSCKSLTPQKAATTDQTATNPSTKPPKKAIPPPVGPARVQPPIVTVAPNRCRLIGQITAILPERGTDSTAVCAQAPCRAKIKIQRVIGYGHAFPEPLAANQEINAYFVFSLNPTEKIFPNMTTPLPGLTIGSLFQADVAHHTEVTGNRPDWYRIEVYRTL